MSWNLLAVLTVSPCSDRQPAHHHVGIPYSLHLVHLVRVDNIVKTGVKIVEEVNHLQYNGDYSYMNI